MRNEYDFRQIVENYTQLLKKGDFAAASECFASDAMYSQPAFDSTVRQDDAMGRAAILDLLRTRRGLRDWAPQIHTLVAMDDLCVVEGDLYENGAWTGMYASSVRVNADGLIARLVGYSTPPIGDSLVRERNGEPRDVDADVMKATIANYVSALERADFEALRDVFSETAVYSHPPYDPDLDSRRADAIGREAIVEMISRDRGDRSWSHETERFVTHRNRAFILGVARESEGGPVEYSYLGAGRFTPEGLINRWVAYGSTPAAGATLGAAALFAGVAVGRT